MGASVGAHAVNAGTCSARTQKFSGMARDDGHGERRWARLLLHGLVASVVLASASSTNPPSSPWQLLGDCAGAFVMRQPTDATESISCPSCSRCSHLELCIISFVLASGSHCSGRLGIAEEYGNLILREMTFLRWCNAWFYSGYMLCVSTLAMDVFHTFSTMRQT